MYRITRRHTLASYRSLVGHLANNFTWEGKVQSTGQNIFASETDGVSGYGAGGSVTQGEAVKQRLWMAIFTVVMFWPLGIAAVIYSHRIPQRLSDGDIAGAVHDSTWVKRMFFIALGAAGFIFLMIIIAVAAGAGTTTTTTGY